MFRKPKRKAKQTLRQKDIDDEGEIHQVKQQGSGDEEESTAALLSEARKRNKRSGCGVAEKDSASKSSSMIMHTYSESKNPSLSTKDLVTSTAQHHPEDKKTDGKAEKGHDGIFRDQTRNKFHAGPIRAAQHVRTTARFDYQPDICKDYKETGFCGFGDTCIYLHDRGDTLAGWQIEQQWEEEQKRKKEKQEKAMSAFMDEGANEGVTKLPEDGLPFGCFICRKHFTSPVVSICAHYFCQKCIFEHVRESDMCPICGKDMNGVFNEPTKLISKKRKVLGKLKSREDNSWEEYWKACQGNPEKTD